MIVVSTDVPTALAPAAATELKSTLGVSIIPTKVSWPAATDPSTAIAGYELQRSVDGGSWTTTATTGTVRSSSGSQVLGHTYQYRVRARDLVGNWGGWAGGPSVTNVLIQDRWSAISYSGTWSRVSSIYASGGTRTWTTKTGAKATMTFSGRGIAIAGQTAVGRGSAAVYIDGVYRGTISFKASTYHDRVVLYSTTFATLGTHTIVLRAAGNGRIDLDAFVILR
jgi:hypothetical protein